jgi:hypothetical protein
MKKLFLLALSVTLLIPAYSKSFLIYKTDTKEVYSFSNVDDAVMPVTGYTKEVLKDDYKDIELQYPVDKYLYKNKKFVANTQKISDEEVAKADIEKKEGNEKIIRQKMRELAITALQAEGKLSADAK